MTRGLLGWLIPVAMIVLAAGAALLFALADDASPDDKAWASVRRADTAAAYEGLIAVYPESEHIPAARARMVELDYERARDVDTVQALARFLAAHPGAPQTAVVEARIAERRADPTIWEHYLARGDVFAYRDFLELYPGHVAEPEARELLRPLDGIDLFELLAAGALAVEASGGGVAAVNLALRDLSGRTTKVIVPAGAYFQSGNASVQSMVTTAPSEIWLEANGVANQRIAAACANLHLGEPGGGDGLTLASAPLEGDLARVLAGTAALAPTARQAAVWIMTDDARYSELTVLNTMTPVDAARGMRLVGETGVDLASRRIWGDADVLFQATLRAYDEETALWIWNELDRPLRPSPRADALPYVAVAAQCGCLDALDALIAAGADVDERFIWSGQETSAIAQAAASRAAVELLLAAGAELDGRGLWAEAVRRGSDDVIALLLERNEPPPSDLPLVALAHDDLDMMALLIAQGQPVDLPDEYGRTPLHVAARSPEATALLLAAGADPNARGPEGGVLLAAVRENFANPDATEVVRLLMEAGADPLDRNDNGDTLLHELAMMGGDAPIAELLIAAGVDPNAVNVDGRTPLHYAALSTYYMANATAAALIDAGARRTPDARGQWPEDMISDYNPDGEQMRELLLRAPE
jgi:ankyrin repeat protein